MATCFDTGLPVLLTGRFDSVTAGAVRDRLHAAARCGSGRLVVDLGAVDRIDATGLGVLVGTHHLADHLGRTMALRNTPPRLARLLRVTGLDRILPTLPPDHPTTATDHLPRAS